MMVQPRKPRRTHTLAPTAPLSQQVGGHGGVHVTEDESLLLKPALPREIAFYQLIRDVDDPSTGLRALKPWIPRFFGVLTLEGKLPGPSADVEPGNAPIIVPIAGSEPASMSGDFNNSIDTASSDTPSQTLVLQNLLYGYRKPCILDVKLGTVLYDNDASEEKKARLIKKAAESTSLQTGMRLTGFQVYSNHSPDPVVYGKAYGYGLKPEQLQDGIRAFFPCSVPTPHTDTHLQTDTPNSSTGLPADTLLTLLSSLHTSLVDLRISLSSAHVRMVGSSVLIIYEGDWEGATAARGRGGPPGLEDVTFEEDEDEESVQIEVEVDEKGEIIMESIPDDASETSSSSSTDAQPRLYTISLIDFAHTRVVLEEGPDSGVLKGMDALISLIAQRKEEIAVLIQLDRLFFLGTAKVTPRT